MINSIEFDFVVSLTNCEIMSSTKALLIIADGSEEMEAVITVDVLRRAKVSKLSSLFFRQCFLTILFLCGM